MRVMKMSFYISVLSLATFLGGPQVLTSNGRAAAQNVDSDKKAKLTYRELRAQQYPVTEGDVLDKPYRIVGKIVTTVKKNQVFEGPVENSRAYKELWERAVKLGADGVVNAHVGAPRKPAFGAWGGRKATGDAIRFVD